MHNLVLMIHIASAIVWVGASFIFSVGVFPSLAQIPNERMIVRTTIRIMNRYLNVALFFSLTLILSATFLVYQNYEIYKLDPILKTILMTKGFIWVYMSASYFYSKYKVRVAKSTCYHGDSLKAVDILKVIANYVFVINFILGLVAIYFGIMLRG